MGEKVGRIIDVLGAALILGLLLRWGTDASRLIATTGREINQLYATASLQGIKAPGEA